MRNLLKFLDSCFPNVFAKSVQLILIALAAYLNLRNRFFKPRKSVLFAGQAYYNAWYLSRELRHLGWRADVLNWDTNPDSQIYYHGEDIKFSADTSLLTLLFFYFKAILNYDLFHFSNRYGIQFGYKLQDWFSRHFEPHYEIYFLKALNKKIIYSNNGCLDGVSQSEFSKWQPYSVCQICIWKNEPTVCNDDKNLNWGKFRNLVTDYQCLYGGNRADYNKANHVHEVPEFYCLNEEVWHPKLSIPTSFKINKKADTIYLYHTIGNKKQRTNDDGINIKSTHVYLPLIDKLNADGFKLKLISPDNVANKDIRFYQVQADIMLDMLTYGWYGATTREAMMLGKPVICYLRPEWLASLRMELPECAEELPIISATPETVEDILRDLIINPDKRQQIGEKSREFSLKWHSDKAAGMRFNQIYNRLLNENIKRNVVSGQESQTNYL